MFTSQIKMKKIYRLPQNRNRQKPLLIVLIRKKNQKPIIPTIQARKLNAVKITKMKSNPSVKNQRKMMK